MATILRSLCVLLLAVVSFAQMATADVADFYRGKSINIVVGYGPGGGYDLYARLLARFLGPHIPGNPSITVQNMPGAASLRATNYLYNVAPKDGTVIGSVDRNMPLLAIVGENSNVQYDPLKFLWLGTLSDSTEDAFLIFSRKKPDLNSLDDLRRPGGPTLTVGVTAPGATDNDVGVLLKSVLGIRLNIIIGYKDSTAVSLAVENGELDGQLVGYILERNTRPAWVDPKGPMNMLVQFARKTRHPELPNVPTARELAPNESARQIIALAELPYTVGRAFVAPPGLPADRAQALQEAFDKVIKDDGFLAESRRLNLDVTPLNSKDTLEAVAILARTPQDLRNQLRDILYPPAAK